MPSKRTSVMSDASVNELDTSKTVLDNEIIRDILALITDKRPDVVAQRKLLLEAFTVIAEGRFSRKELAHNVLHTALDDGVTSVNTQFALKSALTGFNLQNSPSSMYKLSLTNGYSDKIKGAALLNLSETNPNDLFDVVALSQIAGATLAMKLSVEGIISDQFTESDLDKFIAGIYEILKSPVPIITGGYQAKQQISFILCLYLASLYVILLNMYSVSMKSSSVSIDKTIFDNIVNNGRLSRTGSSKITKHVSDNLSDLKLSSYIENGTLNGRGLILLELLSTLQESAVGLYLTSSSATIKELLSDVMAILGESTSGLLDLITLEAYQDDVFTRKIVNSTKIGLVVFNCSNLITKSDPVVVSSLSEVSAGITRVRGGEANNPRSFSTVQFVLARDFPTAFSLNPLGFNLSEAIITTFLRDTNEVLN